MNNFEIGRLGEDAVALYLERMGYRILARNYRSRFGEVDIIFQDRGCIVFGEVKTRSTNYFGEPQEAVNYKKQRRIIATAKTYIANKNITGVNLRFDVFEVYYNTKKIKHIENAYFVYRM